MDDPRGEEEDYEGEEEMAGDEAEGATAAKEEGPYLIFDESGARTLHTVLYLRQLCKPL